MFYLYCSSSPLRCCSSSENAMQVHPAAVVLCDHLFTSLIKLPNISAAEVAHTKFLNYLNLSPLPPNSMIQLVCFWCGVVWCGVVWCGVVWCGAQ
jgi:hypothetical protein